MEWQLEISAPQHVLRSVFRSRVDFFFKTEDFVWHVGLCFFFFFFPRLCPFQVCTIQNEITTRNHWTKITVSMPTTLSPHHRMKTSESSDYFAASSRKSIVTIAFLLGTITFHKLCVPCSSADSMDTLGKPDSPTHLCISAQHTPVVLHDTSP